MAGVVRFLPPEPQTRADLDWKVVRICTVGLVVWAALTVGFTAYSINGTRDSEREWRQSLDKLRAGSYTSPREYWRER